MIKVKNFDMERYKELLEELGNCRHGNRSHRFYEGLQIITPDGYMTDDMKKLLDKWADTERDKSWGKCKQVAINIRDLLCQ